MIEADGSREKGIRMTFGRGIARMAQGGFLVAALVAAAPVFGQTTVGGHIGFVLPLVTRAGGETTTIADRLGFGFPVGITIKAQGRMAFDLEIVPSIETSPKLVTTTIHPGLIWDLGQGFAAGMRVAFVTNSSEWGFTPLVLKSWPLPKENGFFKAYFVEGDLPVRFDRPTGGPATDPVTFALHFGLAF